MRPQPESGQSHRCRLPAGFKHIRHYGLLSPARKKMALAAARAALDVPPPDPALVESVTAFMGHLGGFAVRTVVCRGSLRVSCRPLSRSLLAGVRLDRLRTMISISAFASPGQRFGLATGRRTLCPSDSSASKTPVVSPSSPPDFASATGENRRRPSTRSLSPHANGLTSPSASLQSP